MDINVIAGFLTSVFISSQIAKGVYSNAKEALKKIFGEPRIAKVEKVKHDKGELRKTIEETLIEDMRKDEDVREAFEKNETIQKALSTYNSEISSTNVSTQTQESHVRQGDVNVFLGSVSGNAPASSGQRQPLVEEKYNDISPGNKADNVRRCGLEDTVEKKIQEVLLKNIEYSYLRDFIKDEKEIAEIEETVPAGSQIIIISQEMQNDIQEGPIRNAVHSNIEKKGINYRYMVPSNIFSEKKKEDFLNQIGTKWHKYIHFYSISEKNINIFEEVAIYYFEDERQEAYSLINLPSEGKFIYIKRDKNVLEQYSKTFQFYIDLTDGVNEFNSEANNLSKKVINLCQEIPESLEKIKKESNEIKEKINNTLKKITVEFLYSGQNVNSIKKSFIEIHEDIEKLENLIIEENQENKYNKIGQGIKNCLNQISNQFFTKIETNLFKKNEMEEA